MTEVTLPESAPDGVEGVKVRQAIERREKIHGVVEGSNQERVVNLMVDNADIWFKRSPRSGGGWEKGKATTLFDKEGIPNVQVTFFEDAVRKHKDIPLDTFIEWQDMQHE